jgi:hypothetical protein
MELITIKAKTRGKNTREVEYKGIGKFVTETEKDKDGKETVTSRLVTNGVLTDIKDALAFCDGKMQDLLDAFAVGFNLNAYKGVSDALAEYIEDSWTEGQIGAFRLAVNNLVKLNIPLEKAVEFAKANMVKA